MGKVYSNNTAPLEYTLEVQATGPVDDRFVVLRREDLITESTWYTSDGTSKAYNGMFTSVVGGNNDADKGLYYLLRVSQITKFADVPLTIIDINGNSVPNPLYHQLGWRKVADNIKFDEYTIQLNENNERYVATVDGGNYY